MGHRRSQKEGWEDSRGKCRAEHGGRAGAQTEETIYGPPCHGGADNGFMSAIAYSYQANDRGKPAREPEMAGPGAARGSTEGAERKQGESTREHKASTREH